MSLLCNDSKQSVRTHLLPICQRIVSCVPLSTSVQWGLRSYQTELCSLVTTVISICWYVEQELQPIDQDVLQLLDLLLERSTNDSIFIIRCTQTVSKWTRDNTSLDYRQRECLDHQNKAFSLKHMCLLLSSVVTFMTGREWWPSTTKASTWIHSRHISNLEKSLSFARMDVVEFFLPLHERIFINHLKVVQVHEHSQQQSYSHQHTHITITQTDIPLLYMYRIY